MAGGRSPIAARTDPESRSTTSTLRVAVAGALLGASFGAVTSISNALVSPSEPESLARVASFVLDAGWAWAGVAVAAGWVARAPRRGAVAGVVALLTATTAYFSVDAVHRGEPLGASTAELLRWWLVSLALGWALGLVGAYARRRDVVGLAAALAVPLGAIAQMIIRPPGPPGPAGPGPTAAMTLARWLVISMAVVACAAAVWRFARHLRGAGRERAPGEATDRAFEADEQEPLSEPVS